MSEKSEELIEKNNNTSNIVSKRTIKLPNSVTKKKKEVNSNAINNIIPIESLKEKNLSSKKTKRTLHLNLGFEAEEEKKEEAKSESSFEDENSITMIIPKTSTIKNDKEKLMDTLLDIDDASPVITPSSVTSNNTFLDEPSVFEKFDININNKITSAQNNSVLEPAINLNSSFFYEPSVFEKYSIEISETDSTENIAETENIVKENVQKEIVKKSKIKPVINQNSTADTTSLSLNDLISFDDETESIDDILTEFENSTEEEILIEETTESLDNIEETSEVEDLDALISNQKEYDVIEQNISMSQDDDIINEIIDEDIGDIIEDNLLQSPTDLFIDELSNESNDINILDLVENDEDLLKEVADNIKTPENTVGSAPVGIFIENSGSSKNTDSTLFSKAKSSIVSNITSVFKKFSYDEAANLANSVDDEDDENIIQNVNPISDINQVLGNIEAEPQEKLVTELDVTADSIGLTPPIIDENILDVSSTENELNTLNVLTPEITSSNLSDEELLDLLELDSLNDEEIEEKYKNIEESIPTDFHEEISENDILDTEDSTNDDDFSIEDYFGIEKTEDSNIINEEYDNEFEENIDDLLDDDDDIEFDKELSITKQETQIEEPQNKMSGEELLSLSKLFDNLTNTISSLSTRITELENTKMQPVIIEPEAIKQAIKQVANPTESIEDNNEEECIIEESTEDSIIDTMIEDSIKQNNVEDSIEQNDLVSTDIEDISLDDIDLEDLSGLTISDVLNESTEKQVEEVEQVEEIVEKNISDDINLDDINIDDIDLNDIDLDDISIEENENENKDSDVNEEESIEDLLTTALSSDNALDTQKEELLLELLSDSSNDTTEDIIDNEEPSSDFIKIIDSLSKAISELEKNSLENPIIPESSEEKNVSSKDLGIDSNKAFNILINKDDIFSISILNETYEIIADFDGISVLSENIHISTPKKNFFLKVGNKNIEIHNYKKYFLVYTTFEDVEFANAINNVTFAKKNGRIELNIKEAFKLSSTNNVLELSMLNTSIAKIPASTQVTQENVDDESTSVCDNKTLVISEETQKVYLPYTMNDVMEKLNNTANGYQTIEEVVEKEYVVPLSEFKMPIISRFKEAYKFMRVKEKSSVYEALDLALELMFNSNLNPAIIRAAKDLKELDIYLDCLYENELDKFDRFKIIYKVLPKVQN